MSASGLRPVVTLGLRCKALEPGHCKVEVNFFVPLRHRGGSNSVSLACVPALSTLGQENEVRCG